MLDPFDCELVDCPKGKQRVLAEFNWLPEHDDTAKGSFDLWDFKLWNDEKGNPRFPTIRASNTHGYYLCGKRTFWLISCTEDENEIQKLVNAFLKPGMPTPTYYWCFKIDEVP